MSRLVNNLAGCLSVYMVNAMTICEFMSVKSHDYPPQLRSIHSPNKTPSHANGVTVMLCLHYNHSECKNKA